MLIMPLLEEAEDEEEAKTEREAERVADAVPIVDAPQQHVCLPV
jgi:hypothetical protein